MARKRTDIFVSTVLVLDDQSRRSAAKTKSLAELLKKNYTNYEVIVVDNGLEPKTLQSLKDLLPSTACVRIIRLSRNHDTDTAIFAGIDSAIGDYICILYGDDPVELVPKFIEETSKTDIVFGVARNLKRHSRLESIGARIFYWYNKRFLKINIPQGSTYYICMNRAAANALTRSGRYMRHIRHMTKQVGFDSVNYSYSLPFGGKSYAKRKPGLSFLRAFDLVTSYSRHPLRFVSSLGFIAGFLNIVYGAYVVIINLSVKDVAKGWTTLSLQSSIMFFFLFIVMAVLAEYVGRILEESRGDPPYHITQELSSKINIADETRRNVSK